MENYYICYFFLMQCFFETLEDDLGELLGSMHCEDGIERADDKVLNKWKYTIDHEEMTSSKIADSIAAALESSDGVFDKTIAFIRNMSDCDYYIEQAVERAEEALAEADR